jgi:hypothetical protein
LVRAANLDAPHRDDRATTRIDSERVMRVHRRGGARADLDVLVLRKDARVSVAAGTLGTEPTTRWGGLPPIRRTLLVDSIRLTGGVRRAESATRRNSSAMRRLASASW